MEPRRASRPVGAWCRSLGCPKNRVDTEKFVARLGDAVRLVERPGQAGLLFLNTCGFIEPAVRESLREILDLAAAAGRRKRKPLLVVAGCLVGRYGASALAADLPEVDLWLAPSERDRWGDMVLEALGRRAEPADRVPSTPPSYAYLKISEGCRHRCAFCAIPFIRGGLVSAPEEAVAREAELLVRGGASELVLVAQDLTDYGRDLGLGDAAFPALLRRLGGIEGLKWLRMLYLYPRGIAPELLAAVREVPALLPYFDIPLQHSHPEILRSMGRPFSSDPERVCTAVREALPEAALRTTIIVGYPGETDAHFRHLCDFVERVRFAHLGVFTYWPEEGTPAASLPDQVDQAVKEERRAALMEIQKGISADFLEGQVGRTLDVLVDAPNPEWPGLHEGRTWFQAPEADGLTYVSGPGVEPGAMVRAEVVESGEYDLTCLSVEGADED